MAYGNRTTRWLYYRSPGWLRNIFTSTHSLKRRSERFGGVFASQLDELECDQHRSFDVVAVEQLDSLRRLLAFAGAKVPYYRDLFQKIGFDPAGLQSLDDLRLIPMLDKEAVHANSDWLVPEEYSEPAFMTHTSGTTGKGLHLFLSREANQRSYACIWFHYGWSGIKRGDRIATLAGHPVTRPDTLRPPFWVRDYVENEILFSSQHMTPQTLPLYADVLAEFQPVLICGYPSSVYILALHLLESGRDDIHPKAVYTSSETLMDFQRAAIEEAFGCKAYSIYGNAERSAHILQCEYGNFHIQPQFSVVEVLTLEGAPAEPGQAGEMVCTSLINLAMPLIRYRIGDTAVVSSGSCPCGRGGPILGQIVGRVEDIVVTPDGRHVGRLDHAFKDMLHVKEAQIVQEDINSILVKVVPRDGFGPDDEQVILDELRLRLGYRTGIRLQLVDRIPRTAAGKFRFVISRVPMQIGSNLIGSGVEDGRNWDYQSSN